MFVATYQVHGAADIRTLYFINKVDVNDWVAKNQEEFSFLHISKVFH